MPDCSFVVTTFSRHSWPLQRIATRVMSIVTVLRLLGRRLLRTTRRVLGYGMAVEGVGILVPRVTQLIAIRTPRLGGREAAVRESHSLRHSGRSWRLTYVLSARRVAESGVANGCN